MTWIDFRRQYEAQGREKADGYARADFEGMSDDERAHARGMMLDRALEGDTTDLDGLRHVGDTSTASILASASEARTGHGWRYDVLRHEVVFEITGDHGHLTGLSPYLDARDGEMQTRAAQALASCVLPPECLAFLEERIVDGRHEPAILPLLTAWIAVQRRSACDPACFQRHLEFVRLICRTRPRRRSGLLSDYASAGLE